MKQFIFIFSCVFFSSIFCNSQVESLLKDKETIHKIPKIIHQIWVGKNAIHPQCIKAMQSWKEFHPDWEYKLWTDDDIESFEWTNKELFLSVTNPGVKADIWRYEILNKYGGLYVDVDFLCLKPFDFIHERLAFYSGFIAKLSEHTIANGLFASAPGHPILIDIIESLSGLEFNNDKNSVKHYNNYIMDSTGPYFFTRHVAEHTPLWKDRRVIENDTFIFSPPIFYPIEPKHWKRMHMCGLKIPNVLKKFIKDAYAVHLYARSWVVNEERESTPCTILLQ